MNGRGMRCARRVTDNTNAIATKAAATTVTDNTNAIAAKADASDVTDLDNTGQTKCVH